MLRRCWGLVFLACTLYFLYIYLQPGLERYTFPPQPCSLGLTSMTSLCIFTLLSFILLSRPFVLSKSFLPFLFFFFLMYLLTKAPTVDITQGRFNLMSTGPLNCQSSYGYTCCCYKYYRCHDRISCSICANPILLLGHFLWPLPSTCSCD